VWQRIHDVVSHAAERLTAYSADSWTGKVSNPFRDTLITNIRDLVSLLPRLNVTADAQLEAMRARLEQTLCAYDPQQLRESPIVRQTAADEAARILADMAGYASNGSAAARES